MPRRPWKLPLVWTAMMASMLMGCGGGGDVSTLPAAAFAQAAKSQESTVHGADTREVNADRKHLKPVSNETLLIGTSSRMILQVHPRSGKLIASLKVELADLSTGHIAADGHTIYFGGIGLGLGRYDIASGEQVRFAWSDGFTSAVAMAVSPAGTLFASNLYAFPPDTLCGTCSVVVAYPDPNGQDPAGRAAFEYGYVREPFIGNGRLSGQQIGFTQTGALLVASSGGDGIYVSTYSVDEACCGTPYLELPFTQLIGDPTNTTIRFADDGHGRLFVLQSTGRIGEYDIATGGFEKIFLQAGLIEPIEIAISHDGSVYVLEKSGVIRGFSKNGKEISSIAVPAAAGQPLSITFCCSARHRHHSRQ